MTEKVYDSHQGLILKLSSKIIIKCKNKILPMMPCKKCALNFKKRHFEESYKKLAILKSFRMPFGFTYFNELGTVVQWSFLVIRNTSARICLNILDIL